MWAAAGIIAVCAVIAMMEIPPLRKNRQYKELWVFCILLMLGAGLSIAKAARLPIPNPLDGIAAVYKPASDVIFSLLK